ncbi:MAG: hypothetical protein V7L01_10735 [Nostoc sp.]|uniref:hypothetical protein n=1 Tax=Nostoc sp. TaxID=1180 RepID=UPI002FF5713E
MALPCPYQRICIIIKVKWYYAKVSFQVALVAFATPIVGFQVTLAAFATPIVSFQVTLAAFATPIVSFQVTLAAFVTPKASFQVTLVAFATSKASSAVTRRPQPSSLPDFSRYVEKSTKNLTSFPMREAGNSKSLSF